MRLNYKFTKKDFKNLHKELFIKIFPSVLLQKIIIAIPLVLIIIALNSRDFDIMKVLTSIGLVFSIMVLFFFIDYIITYFKRLKGLENNCGQISIELTDKYIIVNGKVNFPVYKIRKIQNLKHFIFIDFKEGALPINKIIQESSDDLNKFMTILKSRISKKKL